MNRILITGNLGYNGVQVTKTLNEAGYETIGFDVNYYPSCFFKLDGYLPDKQICKDIRRISPEDLKGVDGVIDLAALSNDATGELSPKLTDQINRQASIKLAELAKANGVSKFIFASSCSVYGLYDPDAYADENSPIKPLTAYAKAKVEAESELLKLHDKSFNVTIMRNATMYGLSPKLRLDLVVNNLAGYAHVYKKVKILSDGTPWRPLLSVTDFAQAVVKLLQSQPKYIIYNVGFEDEIYQIRELGEIVSEIFRAGLEINKDKTPDERSYKVDFQRFRDEFPEFRPQSSVRKGTVELMKAYKQYELDESDFAGPKYFRIRWLKDLLSKGYLSENLERIDGTDA